MLKLRDISHRFGGKGIKYYELPSGLLITTYDHDGKITPGKINQRKIIKQLAMRGYISVLKQFIKDDLQYEIEEEE